MTNPYERPSIKTVPAREIVESMGPVSCGSAETFSAPGPFEGMPTVVPGGPDSGFKHLQ